MTTNNDSGSDKKILVVDDNAINTRQLAFFLNRKGFKALEANSGEDALKILETTTVDAIISDWLMPGMDGPTFLEMVRKQVKPMPISMMLTVLDNPEAKRHAISVVGVDEFISKPYDPDKLVQCLNDCFSRSKQTVTTLKQSVPPPKPTSPSPIQADFAVVMIATSTGGPQALTEFLKQCPRNDRAAYFVVQHGPDWLQETLAASITSRTDYNACVAKQNQQIEPGQLYLAPGDFHMTLSPSGKAIRLTDSPPVNFVRPAADPLFENGASLYGPYCVGVVLSGLGADGSRGALAINRAGGQVFVQDPDEAVAPYMPRNVIELDIAHEPLPINQLGQVVSDSVAKLASQLARV